MKHKQRGRMSSEEFSEELLSIFEEKLAQLPPEEQDARIKAFEDTVARTSRHRAASSKL